MDVQNSATFAISKIFIFNTLTLNFYLYGYSLFSSEEKESGKGQGELSPEVLRAGLERGANPL